MTILGPDLSSYQDGLDVADLPYPFVIAKCTEGTYYVDRDYDAWRHQAAAAGKLFVPYHFVSGENAVDQARALAAHIGDKALPAMLDFEPTTGYRPDLIQLIALADAARAQGLHIALAYIPHWYWVQIGSPSLASLAARGIALVSSDYPGGTGYPGDDAAGWQLYGGMIPALYQYTDHAPIQGRTVDMNAYRGTIQQLAARLGLSAPTPTTGDNPMGNIPPSIAAKWPEIGAELPPNGPFDDSTAIIWADGGARAAALYALQARDEIRQLAARYAAPPPVDVNALAAALRPLIQGGADAETIAHAVIVELGAVLKAGGA